MPEIGGIQVAVEAADRSRRRRRSSKSVHRDVQADVSRSVATVRVYVVEMWKSGAYDVSSLSMLLNALHEAGGPTSRGSLRTLKHYRGKQLIEDVDVYDLLLHGVRSALNVLRLE